MPDNTYIDEMVEANSFTPEQVAALYAANEGEFDSMTDFTPTHLAYQFTLVNLRAAGFRNVG